MIDIERKYLVIMMEAGYIYLGMQRFKESREVFKGVSILSKDSEIPLIALGGVDFCEGKFDSAVTWYKKALKIDPESVFAKVYLGEVLFFAGKKKEAIKLLEEVSGIDRKGGAGEFARAFLDAVNQGFTPEMIRGFKK